MKGVMRKIDRPTAERLYGPIPAPDGTDPVPAVGLPSDAGLAPAPVVDKWPLLIGQGLSLSYLASTIRTAINGYRQQFVDLLDELLQKEPHGYSVLWKRILAVAGARLSIDKPEWIKTGDPEEEEAEMIRSLVERQVLQIPNLRQHLAFLMWAVYYAIVGLEIHWKRGANGEWIVRRLSFIFSRRLSYPDQQSWDLFIWDQGQVLGHEMFGNAPTNVDIFGLRVKNFPYKFIIHAPQLRGDYPTREGLGLEVAEWFIFKRLGARMASQYLERFGKPFMDIEYSTQPDGFPREAVEGDIALANATMPAIGSGSASGWVHPNSVKLEPKSPDGKGTKAITFKDWLGLCNGEISKPILGSTLTTDSGMRGSNRSLGEVHERSELRIDKYDAGCLGDSVSDQLLRAIVVLNCGPDKAHLTPRLNLHVEEPDPAALMQLATHASQQNVPVDADALAREVGLTLTPNKSGEPRRMFPLIQLDLDGHATNHAGRPSEQEKEADKGEAEKNGESAGTEEEEPGEEDKEDERAPEDGDDEEDDKE